VLAREIDRLETHLDQYGSIVAKQPDVWGEARLTRHRREYEEQMKTEVDKFAAHINAQISRTDQAYLAAAASLSGVIAPPTVAVGTNVTPPTGDPATPSAENGGKAAGDAKANAANSMANETTTVENRAIGLVDKTVIVRETLLPAPRGFSVQGGSAGGGIALEQTLLLDQKSRFLDHLHELRRAHEGDETRWTPGYALHVVRIPISILPGKKTRVGYGAEVTVSVTPVIGEDALSSTFRSAAINDVVEMLGLMTTRIAEESGAVKQLKAEFEIARKRRDDAVQQQAAIFNTTKSTLDDEFRKVKKEVNKEEDTGNETDAQSETNQIRKLRKKLEGLADNLTAKLTAKLNEISVVVEQQGLNQDQTKQLKDIEKEVQSMVENVTANVNAMQGMTVYNRDEWMRTFNSIIAATSEPQRAAIVRTAQPILRADNETKRRKADVAALQAKVDKAQSQLNQAISTTSSVSGGSRATRVQDPLAPTLIRPVIGSEALQTVGAALLDFHLNETGDKQVNGLIHLMDAQKFLRAELQAAYDFLLSNERLEVWNLVGALESSLEQAIRSGRVDTIQSIQSHFYELVDYVPTSLDETGATQVECPDQFAVTKALAWALLVESALLNKRLALDMQELASAKGCGCAVPDGVAFYGPDPSPEARQAFQEYVRCRWPAHVFAVDPINQEQNVADSLRLRRELQLALALAFTNGQIGADTLARYSRRFELDTETIALNRTVIGFSHGNDVFGWRFQPRFQSPDTEGNCKTLVRTLFTGGPTKDQILRDQRLEPGMRHCVAMILLPACLRYATFDVRTNWFRLTNPAKSELSMAKTVELSSTIRCAQETAMAAFQSSQLYRDGEVMRLARRLDQLSAELPLQSLQVQLPAEKGRTGGFELFNTNVTDLRPRLAGFYGEPGVSDQRTTKIFLVGDNLSAPDVQIIAGGLPIEPMLLSEQVAMVSIPNDFRTTTYRSRKVIDVHAATAYGVSDHIYVPVMEEAKPPATQPQTTKFAFATDRVRGTVFYDECGRKEKFCLEPEQIVIEDQGVHPETIRVTDAQIAFFVRTKSGEQVADTTQSTNPLVVKRDEQSGALMLNEKDLSCELLKLMPTQSGNLTGLVLEGFLRCNDTQLVTKIQGQLVIDVNTTKVVTSPFDCPQDTPSQGGARQKTGGGKNGLSVPCDDAVEPTGETDMSNRARSKSRETMIGKVKVPARDSQETVANRERAGRAVMGNSPTVRKATR
jgi:hypothetical protein